MGAGIATTLHFTYPVFVTLLMGVLFRERASWVTWIAIVLAVGGVAKLSLQGGEMRLDAMGVTVVLLSAVGYASYIIAVNKSRIRDMHSRKLAFYVFVFTTLLFALKNGVGEGLQPLPDAVSVLNIVLLAVAPTVISNITLLLAVRYIGGTTTSILGALETGDGRLHWCFPFRRGFLVERSIWHCVDIGSGCVNYPEPTYP